MGNRSRSHTLHAADVRESFSVEETAIRIRIQKIADRGVTGRSDWRFFSRLIFWALTVLAFSAFSENPEMAMDKMTDDELRAFREQKVAELKHRAHEVRSEQVADGWVYPRSF